tara:strand:+ start:1229 stop:1474 length:246 start_codon:yes stop_codon:yes gene_type:complete
MANSTIVITLDVLNTEVKVECEVQWYVSECNEVTIQGFIGYHITPLDVKQYERIPDWLAKIITDERLIEEEYLEDVESMRN